MNPARASHDEILPPRAPWTRVLRRGQTLRLIDIEGTQAVDALFYHAGDPGERYSAQDTLRAQSNAYLGLGSKLLSNEGAVMLTITADSCGRHDSSAGCCSCESNSVRFGHKTKYMRSCRENFLTALSRHGLGKRDVVSNLNFFMNVPIEPDGALAIVDGVSKPGDYVDLRAEMDVLCVFSNCPQVNNPCNGFNPTPVRILIWDE
jgi:urea carboxylase-associated protein 1